jgi:hypothetical protein
MWKNVLTGQDFTLFQKDLQTSTKRNKVLEVFLKWQNTIPAVSVNRSNGGKNGNSGMNLIQSTEENMWILFTWCYIVEGILYILRYEAPGVIW